MQEPLIPDSGFGAAATDHTILREFPEDSSVVGCSCAGTLYDEGYREKQFDWRLYGAELSDAAASD